MLNKIYYLAKNVEGTFEPELSVQPSWSLVNVEHDALKIIFGRDRLKFQRGELLYKMYEMGYMVLDMEILNESQD